MKLLIVHKMTNYYAEEEFRDLSISEFLNERKYPKIDLRIE